MSALIEFRDVYKIYEKGRENEVRAVDGISFKVPRGDFLAIVGQSGSGKSTCMNIIGALDVPTSGSYFLDGRNTAELSDDELAAVRNRMIGFVFQQYNLIGKISVFENVELPLIYAGLNSTERKERVMSALNRVGLDDKTYNFPNQLSGGQQQRVSIARALSTNPAIILADEPTGALDSKTGAEVLEFLCELNRDGSTVILVTHDREIASYAKRTITLKDGKITADGGAER